MTKLNDQIINFLYTTAVVIIFTYNPLFYIGHFDPVEEGFWLAWVERLRNGQTLYRDFFAFHPPAITKGAYYFMATFGASIYNLRLYLQLLQVTGYLFIYLVINYFLKNNWNKVLTFVVILILTYTFVRNNTVFRVSSGLIALLPLFVYFKNQNIKLLLISGALSAISFFISPEVGLSVLVTLSITLLVIFINNPKNLRIIILPFLGVILGSLAFVVELFLRKSIGEFVKQIYYYSTAFSGVYNSPIERPAPEPMFLWLKLNDFIGSAGWFWEAAKFSVAAAFLVFYHKVVGKKIDYLSKSSAVLGLFAVLLTISFLGRSDYYHLLFILIPVVIISIYLLELLSTRFKYTDKIFLLFIIFYALRGTPSDFFIQNNLNKFQSYANPLGNYFKLDLERGGIYVTDATYPIDMKKLINYINEKVDRNEKIFVYPWSPEIYFLSQRENATSYDTPLASFSEEYQKQMVKQLVESEVKFIVYNPEIKFLNLSVTSLPSVNNYILDNFKKEEIIGNFQILIPK